MRDFLRRHRLTLVWGTVLLVSTALQTFTVLDDARAMGRPMALSQALLQEATSHAMWAVLLFPIYWLHRRYSIQHAPVNIVVHLVATIPVSLAHVLGMVGLRYAVAALLGLSYRYDFTLDHLVYEYRKDLMTYLIFSAAYVALGLLFARLDERRQQAPTAVVEAAGSETAKSEVRSETAVQPPPPLTRFAVRKKDREVLVSADEIGWIEAAGNYAILHVGGEKHEIRSSLARLESELDPASFVRVHKSAIVNLAQVREVEPWISGDWRLRLQDGTQVPLSRRYRARFEEKAPVRR